MAKEIKYTTDKTGVREVYAGKLKIARSVLGTNGYEVQVLQGVPRTEVVNKIIADCPKFAEENNLHPNYYPKLFSR